MKPPRLEIDCEIAGGTVIVSLRKGGGFREPAGYYVRCDDRDCQYVDLNQPPCPLRRDMFADSRADSVGALLATRAGERFCYLCIADAVSIEHDEVRRAAWRLQEGKAVTIAPGRCIICRHRRITLALINGTTTSRGVLDSMPAGSLAQGDPNTEQHTFERVRALLADSQGLAYCAACLALATQRPLMEVRGLLESLDGHSSFQRHDDACGACGRWQTVAAFRPRPARTANLDVGVGRPGAD